MNRLGLFFCANMGGKRPFDIVVDCHGATGYDACISSGCNSGASLEADIQGASQGCALATFIGCRAAVTCGDSGKSFRIRLHDGNEFAGRACGTYNGGTSAWEVRHDR